MYVAIGAYAWGRGTTREQAISNATKNIPTFYAPKEVKFNVYETDDSRCYVDERGRLISTAPVHELQPA